MCEAIQGLIDDSIRSEKKRNGTAHGRVGILHSTDCTGAETFRRRRTETHSEIILIHTLAVS